jgi:mannose-6-phosphate isomerase
VKAAAVRIAAGDLEAPAVACKMLCALNNTFLGRPFAGGWIDHFEAAGSPLVAYVPASSLYHIYCAGAEIKRIPQMIKLSVPENGPLLAPVCQ